MHVYIYIYIIAVHIMVIKQTKADKDDSINIHHSLNLCILDRFSVKFESVDSRRVTYACGFAADLGKSSKIGQDFIVNI